MLPVNAKAPGFELPDQHHRFHRLSDYRGKWVILYFYPKDDTPGCTKEACSFRDSYHEFEKRGMIILGVSKDSVASHLKFAEKYQLDFPLLADVDTAVIRLYEAWGIKKFMGREFEGTRRVTYVIAPDETIYKTYEKVNPLTHASQILADLPQ